MLFVTSVFAGGATLTWNPPTTNADGSPLTDLAGYKVYQGTTPGVYGTPVDVPAPGISSYLVPDLPNGTHYFAVTAYDTSGNESDYSNEAAKTITASLPDQPVIKFEWVETVAFPTGWNRKCKLTIQSSKVSATLTDFPVLITEDTLPSEIFDADGSNPAQNGGGDIRFSSDSAGTTQLPVEIVSFVTDNNPANGTAEIYVKVASISSSVDTDIYIWYNTAGSDSQPAVTDTYGRNNVWDANYLGVYHLESTTITDSTGTTDGTNSGTSAATGQLGGGLDFDGSLDYIDLNRQDLDTTNGTIEWWANPDGAYNDGQNWYFWAVYSGTSYSVQKYTDNKYYAGWNHTGDDRVVLNCTATNWLQNTWQKYDLTWADGGSTYFYHNKTELGSQAGTSTGNIAGNMELGRINLGSKGEFDGTQDEYRFSNVVRSAAWRDASTDNQTDPSTFVVEGTPEAAGGGATHEAGLSLGVSSGVSDSITADFAGAMSLGVSSGLSDAATADFAGAVSLGVSAGVGDTPAVDYQTAVSLGVVKGLGQSGGLVADGDLSIGVSHGVTADADVSIEGNITLALSHGAAASAQADFSGSVAFSAQLSHSTEAAAAYVGTLTLGVSSGLDAAGAVETNTYEVSINLGVSHGAAAAVQTDFAAGLQLGIQAGLSGGTIATLNDAVSLGVSIGHAMAAVIGQPITPDSRTLTFRSEGRTLTIDVEDRTITVRV